MEKTYNILVVNPGSTSTKVALYENNNCIFDTDVFHDSSLLKTFPTINDQIDYRMEVVYKYLKENEITDIDIVVARGGSSASLESGVYLVNDKMIKDTHDNVGMLYHSSMLGVQMGKRLSDEYHCPLITMDPTVVDEFEDVARITGIKGIYRRSILHALNLRANARKYAEENNLNLDELNLIVAHIDGGITVTAMKNNRMIDCNDGGGGDGPFTPTRMGTMAVTDVINNLIDLDIKELKSLISQTGGLSSHFGTSNSDKIHKMIEDGDEYASLVWNAMIYQICKQIGAMATVLHGKVDAIVLTGGLMRFDDIKEGIKESCGWIAPIVIYPGEEEMKTLARAGYEYLTDKITPKEYTGIPVFDPNKFNK